MAKIKTTPSKPKSSKVLKFKNIPTKKERVAEQKTTKKKKTVSLPFTKKAVETPVVPLPVMELTPVKEEPIIEKPKETTVSVPESENTPAVTPSGGEDAFLSSSFEKETKANYSPNIFRFITDRWFLSGLVCGVLIIGIFSVWTTVSAKTVEKQALEQKRAGIQKEISYWQDQTKVHPDSRDGYFQLALLEYQLGNFQVSQAYLTKVESIDPNFQQAKDLEKLLQK